MAIKKGLLLITIIILLLLIAVIVLITNFINSQSIHPLRLWYNKPANASVEDIRNQSVSDAEWLKALPVGNGFLGAMVFGDVNKERIQLNEKSLWSGSPDDNDNPYAYDYLDKIRQLLWSGKYKEATDLTMKTQVCKGVGSGHGNGATVPYGCFQTLGDLWLDFENTGGFKNYHRELDLNRGVVLVSYEQNGISFKREIFASYPDRALVIRLTSNKKGSMSFNSTLTRPERYETYSESGQLLMTGTLDNGKGGNGMRYAVRLMAVTKGGQVSFSDNTMDIKKADEVVLILTASTNYKLEYPDYQGNDPKITSRDQLTRASAQRFPVLLKNHVDDYTALFGKVSLKLSNGDLDTVPTDIRLINQHINPDDLHLQEIYFQFGRYLLIASSREGSLPANLQGVWANKIQTPWNGDYHTDINVQMNYWPADVTNLSECYGPLTDLIESLVKPGEKTAGVQYKAKGWCVHPITNVWGFTSPGEHPGWGMHLGAGGWLCQHLWDHYTFTMDKNYLEKVYPIMLKSAQFYLDWLVRDPNTGKLVSGPASSPENSFIAPDGSVCHISMGPSHDQQIIHKLFTNVLKASSVLEDNDPLLTRINTAIKDLAMHQIASDGRLMEWAQEYPEREPTHRHVSHLYILYPGAEVDLERTPELASAVRKSLEVRGDGGTGWSLSWKINLWARLKEGDHAYILLKNLLQPTGNFKVDYGNSGGTFHNLFCAHPPYQIDGNFGATSGIAEMLLQSHNGYIELLPALPGNWKNGHYKGLRVRGGATVNVSWENLKIKKASLRATASNTFKIKLSDINNAKFIINGRKAKSISIEDDFVTIKLKKNDILDIIY